MSKIIKYLIAPLAVALVLAGIILVSVKDKEVQNDNGTLGALTLDNGTSNNVFRNYTFFSATTTSATSTNITPGSGSFGEIDNGYLVIAGAEQVSMIFSRGGATGPNTGTSTFYAEVSPDAVTWYPYNKLISNVTNTNSQTLTRVGSVAIEAATSTTVVGLDLTNDSFFALRCKVVETIDGDHTCKASAEF